MSNTRLVIHTLMTGKSLKTRDVAQMMTELSEKEIKVQDISGLLSKISDPQKCDMGYFIRKTRDGVGFTYTLVKEMLDLPLEKAYGLTLKAGKNRYPLEKAFLEYPELRKHVENGCSPVENYQGSAKIRQSNFFAHENTGNRIEQKQAPSKPIIRFMKKLTDARLPSGFINLKPSSDTPSAGSGLRLEPAKNRNMELTLRYSSKYSLSVSASLTTFFLICCAIVLTIAASCLILYWFFYSVFVVIFLLGLGVLGVLLYRKLCGIPR